MAEQERKLHIGGKVAQEGWEIFNAIAAPNVDHEGNAKDLSKFEDNTFSIVYSSHVLEHFDYKDELLEVLKEWRRVLIPNGLLMASVPDLDILTSLLTKREQFNVQERYHIMRMIFGGHMDDYDYHYVGLNFEFLSAFLSEAGFKEIKRVKEFGLFHDTSTMLFKDVPISLNMIARK